ncbi:MAG TPA: hypothetical protein DCG78_07305 [Anaerolineaceae bacterium]|nr:hypothetical protein [Anaerolineaceae bacterium]
MGGTLEPKIPKLDLSIETWHNRYQVQAGWTQTLRNYLLSKVNCMVGERVLDVGCGTGVLFEDFEARGLQAWGVDWDVERCQYALPLNREGLVFCGNGAELPIEKDSFDLSVCHYVLMWQREPLALLQEMKRVTKPGKYVIAFAEPDYQARIDYPEIFERIGQVQNRSLAFQGADLTMGRKMKKLFLEAGLQDIHGGSLAGVWGKPTAHEFENEWDIIAYDLGGLMPVDEILELKQEAMQTWLEGKATVYIPTLYAYGKVPEESA